MRFNTLVKLTSLLSLASIAYCGGSKMTFYGLNNNRPSVSAPPSCGIDGVDLKTEYYIALNKDQYTPSQARADNPNTASVCNKCVKITYNNKWVVGRIIDKCPGCPHGGLDVSPTLFKTLEDLDTGVVYMDWEYTDCSLLGKSGSCSGGKCTTSSPKEESKPVVKKTTTRKTTTTVRRTTNVRPTTVVRPTTIVRPTQDVSKKPVVTNKPVNTKTIAPSVYKTPNTTKSLPNNINTKNPTNNVNANTNNPVAPLTGLNNANTGSNGSTGSTGSTNNAAPAQTSTKQTGPTANNIANEEKEGSNYVLPLTGAVVVTGAAGFALLYVKRDSNNINNLKEKFPEAFNNIKRSISRGSSQLRRSLSNSSMALKRSLSKKGNDQYEQYDPSGPHIRTKKEYRASLDAHYPIQLHDPPVSQTYQPSSKGYENSQPKYHLQNFNTKDDGNMRIDFHDSYY